MQAKITPDHYSTTQADIDNNGGGDGDIDNTATSDSDQLAQQSASATVAIIQTPSYTMTKTADVARVNADGDIIGYTITLTNTGNVTLTGIVVNDALLGGAVAGSATIAVGGSEDYIGSYGVLQADIDNNGGGDGDIDNTATSDSDQLAQQSASETVAIIQTPSYTMTKTADVASVNADGDVIGYTITLTNTGNVTLTGIVVNDALLGGAVAGSATVAVGASEDYTGSYSTTQADIDNNGGGDGDIDNTATSDSDQLAQQSASETVAIIQSPSYTMTKTADVASVNADGDVIGYTITLTNTGNVTLTGIVVNDALLGGAVAGSASIAVGASEDYTGSYSTTQADIDNNGGGDGDIDNTATSDSDQLAQQSASETVAIIQTLSYTMTKTADVAGVNADGDVIGYTITLTNTGNVTLTGIVVNDVLLGGAVAGSASIAVGASEDYTGSYSVLQADIDNNGGGDGDIDNTATSDSDQLAQQSASETVAIIPNAFLHHDQDGRCGQCEC